MPTTITTESEGGTEMWRRDGEKLATRVGSREMTTPASESRAAWSLSNLNARINAHWMRGKHRDSRSAIVVSRPLYASIGAGHVRRKPTRGRRAAMSAIARHDPAGGPSWSPGETETVRHRSRALASAFVRTLGLEGQHVLERQRRRRRRRLNSTSTDAQVNVIFYAPSSGEHHDRSGLRSVWRGAALNVCPVKMSYWIIIFKTLRPLGPRLHCFDNNTL